MIGSGAYRTAQDHPGGLGPAAQRVEGRAVVVVAADRDDVRAGGPKRRQRPRDDPGRLRRRARRVVQVAGDDDEVGAFRPRDVDDLGQGGDVIVHSGLSFEDLPDVPVRGVQDPHGSSQNGM